LEAYSDFINATIIIVIVEATKIIMVEATIGYDLKDIMTYLMVTS